MGVLSHHGFRLLVSEIMVPSVLRLKWFPFDSPTGTHQAITLLVSVQETLTDS